MRHLLIDADVLAYKAATSVEKAVEWEPGMWTYHADFEEAKAAFVTEFDHVMNKLNGDCSTLALTDTANFRKEILPTYKANRSGNRKPLVLKPLRAWLLAERNAKMKPGLEGDDVLGIMSTMKRPDGEERIIVSVDKDMKTIPGLYTRDLEEVVEVDEGDADYWHMFQTLIGDPTDGYSGCPGVGKVKATKELNSTVDGLWADVVRVYEKYGFTAEDALVQARVARILRASDYDFKTNQPILWSPHG